MSRENYGAIGAAKAARSSAQPDFNNTANLVTDLVASYKPLGNHLPWVALDYVELLAVWNPDYAQAVDNIRTLANSGHILYTQDGADDTALRYLLQLKARTVQARHGGIDGLIDKLLWQGATFGAMCGEWVTDEDLSDVVDFLDVSPKSIRFIWEDEHWAPYQMVDWSAAQRARRQGQTVRGNLVKLNEATFHYYAFNAEPSSPYGTPPFLAALPGIAIQRDLIKNMAKIVKKVGLLGILDLTIEQVQKKPGETEDDFRTRATSFLQSYATAVEDMVETGGLAHFDDVKLETQSIVGNAAGATNIFRQNEELIFSGLRSMPSVQGRSYSTTETYAGVSYDIIIRNTLKYQRAVKRMVESGYWLAATLQGFNPERISIEFNPNKTLNRLHDANSQLLEIRSALLLWATGIVDQAGAAQLLGYNDSAKKMEEPPDSPLIRAAGEGNVNEMFKQIVDRLQEIDHQIPKGSTLLAEPV
jgi:hypothetical protein